MFSRIWWGRGGDIHEKHEIVSSFWADVRFSGRGSVAFMLAKELTTLVWLSRASLKLSLVGLGTPNRLR